MIPLKSQAIQTALIGDWKAAIDLNKEILREDPSDIESLNRLAFAYAISGDTKNAQDTYKSVLTIDNQNPIALRGLKRLSSPSSSNGEASSSPVLLANMFLEETGKTKIINLVNVADSKITSRLRTGEKLTLCVKRLKVFLLDPQKQFVGMIPDDIGKRLIKFLDGGNDYEAYVKSIENNKVTIFVKETKRAAKFKNQPSFISTPYHNDQPTHRPKPSSDDSRDTESE